MISDKIKEAGFIPVQYSKRKDPVILFMALDRDDNNKFTARMTKALLSLSAQNKKLSPKNISIESRYNMKEIELNLFEIETIMDSLGL